MYAITNKVEHLMELGGTKKEVVLLVISGIALFISIFDLLPLPFNAAWIAIVFCGIPIILEAIIGLVTDFDIKADVLVSLALIAAVYIGEDFAAGEVAFIMQVGALLEDLTVAKARAGIEKLVHLTPQTARVITNGIEQIVPAEQVQIDDLLRVLAGETIPVDGVIVSGQTSVNQAVMTGESLPVDKTVGDDVLSGTVNQFGAFEMKAARACENSSIQRMIKLVQSVDAGKAKIVGIADRWATWIVVIALGAAALTWFLSGEIIRAVTILVVFCPCALVLATPTAIMAAIGNATTHGFLVREGDALERLAKVSKLAFDKTGTLTYGKLNVIEVKSILPQFSEKEFYTLAAAAEQLSEHPLGKAIVRCHKKEIGTALSPAQQFQMIPGEGISVVVHDNRILAGNARMLAQNGVTLSDDVEKKAEQHFLQGHTVIYITIDRVLAGFIVLSDTIRAEGVQLIEQLQAMDVRPVLLTGDNENTSATIANELGIHEVHANCLPEDKLKWIGIYQGKGEAICMIGDGVNDAPALKKATVGIAMGGVGSDIAVDAADIVLVDDEVKELPHLLALSRRMMTTIRYNLAFSLGLNFLAIALAIPGILNPVIGALVHNAGSIIVIVNSALLLKWRKRK
ncbi:cation-translocating P-type ATPase [Aminipila butyrica]|uniref:Cd(2+)-exporting ATPase n=1 Tax=Aminipila butyrica TaxID=433296 RepID=A0A858BVD6_9FIRM|nr:cation-translocating P-type ATPase [Aminipila butyrica]QIB68880.1 cation-translocating P-type ATPase [Aminipila butyrica]